MWTCALKVPNLRTDTQVEHTVLKGAVEEEGQQSQDQPNQAPLNHRGLNTRQTTGKNRNQGRKHGHTETFLDSIKHIEENRFLTT